MFDVKSETNEFVGEDRAEAVAKACRFYAVDDDALQIFDVADVFGLGARCVVVARLKDAARPSGGGGRSERDSGRGRDRDRPRDRDRSRGRDGGREAGRGRGRGGRDGGESRGSREGRGPVREDREPERERQAPEGPSEGTRKGEVGVIGEFVLGVVERMGVGSFELSESAEGDFVIIQLEGEGARELGAGDGRALDAVQLLANQAAMRESDEPARVVVDAEGDSERREGFLERLAERAAGRAQDTGRSIALDPMNARDRRMVHVALREMEGVATKSVGSGRYRQVVVVPEGDPEYADALASSQQERD